MLLTNKVRTLSGWLQAMRSAAAGVYCGPLRLLAMEVFDACNVEGTFCSLITGAQAHRSDAPYHVGLRP